MIAEPKCWADARAAEIKRLEDMQMRIILNWVDGRIPRERFLTEIKSLKLTANRIASSEEWLAPRPRRKMPRAQAVACYWQRQGKPFDVEVDYPRCFACKTPSSRWNHFERAHLVDRFLGGLDHEANLAMICPTCHRIMPMFEPGQHQKAIEWVLSNPLLQVTRKVVEEWAG